MRNPILAGEPIRREKLLKGSGGYMSAILPAGMRAVAISIDNRGATSAGGFILPNDRVDVIKTVQSSSDKGAGPATSEIILTNIRVLAIGQTIQERNGEKVVTGETATLELTPAQDGNGRCSPRRSASSPWRFAASRTSMKPARPRGEERSALQIIRFGVQQQALAT